MSISLVSAALLLLALSSTIVLAEGDKNSIVNGNFTAGLASWKAEGMVSFDPQGPKDLPLTLGPSIAKVSQRYVIEGTRIVYFGATLQVEGPSTAGAIKAMCFDSHDKVVMEQKSGTDPTKNARPQELGLYFKTQARTTYIVVSIESTTKAGVVHAGKATLVDYDLDRRDHAPACDLNRYMAPIWQGNKVVDESVLMLSEDGKPPSGKLLFRPDLVLAVRDSTLKITFKEGLDYAIEGRTLSLLPGSKMPSMKSTDFPKGDFPWLSLVGKHVLVTYTHHDRWAGPTPGFCGREMPNTMRNLLDRKPLTVVAYGDSITLGINVSGYRIEPPYMPTWADLFVWRLRQIYKLKGVSLVNAALGGMTSEWGKDNANSAVAELKPDLVLICFGMNDFWSISGKQFKVNVQAILDRVRAKSPRTEFVLISSIRFDPAYTNDPTYVEHFDSYIKALNSLTGKGVQMLDMAGISQALYIAKRAKDLLADPMHPDDFLARWYAQGLVAMFEPTSHSSQSNEKSAGGRRIDLARRSGLTDRK